MNDQTTRARSSLAREPRALRPAPDARRRVALIVEGGRRRSPGRLAETVRQLRRLSVPGHRIELLSGEDTDELDHDVLHLCGPSPASFGAEAAGIPVVWDPDASDADAWEAVARRAIQSHPARLILSPTRAADLLLLAAGVAPARIARWQPGVERERFSPARYRATSIPTDSSPAAPFHVLHAGPLEQESGVLLLAEALRRARARDPRLTLVLARAGGAESELRAMLGPAAVFLGNLDDDALAEVLATAELCVCPDPGPGFSDVVLQAQASGLPVLAIDGSGGAELIESGRSGCVVAADADALGAAIAGLARRATLRERLSTGGLLAVRERSWERSLSALGAVWELAPAPAGVTRAA